MAGYLGAIPVPQATQHRESFTATSGQTSFSTAGYTPLFLDVYLNGSHLSPADFTATNGSDVVLASGASAGDVCDIISYTAFEVNSQTFTGTTTMDVAAITGVLTANGGAVFNEGSADVDFRVESNGNPNMLFVDGGNDAVGIGTGSPTQLLTVGNTSTQFTRIQFYAATNGASTIHFGDGTSGADNYQGYLNYAHDSNSMQFATSSTERMRIDSSGNVGIGCIPSSIQSNFDTLQIGGNLTLNVDSTGAGAGVYMGNNVYRDSTNSRWEYIFTDEASQYYQANGTHVWRTAASGSADAAITWSEAMRLTSAGGLLIGTTSNSSVSVAGYRFIPGATGYSEFVRTGSDGSANIYIARGDNGRALGFFRNDGSNREVGTVTLTTNSTAYNTSSDYRLKTDAQPMSGASDRVLALNPVNFEWISSGERVDGFLAHEAQEIVPEAVTGTKDAMMDEEYEVTPAVLDDDGNVVNEAVMGTRSVPAMQGIDQSKMVPLLVAALQEALARITALENA